MKIAAIQNNVNFSGLKPALLPEQRKQIMLIEENFRKQMKEYIEIARTINLPIYERSDGLRRIELEKVRAINEYKKSIL